MNIVILLFFIYLLTPFSRGGCGNDDAGGPYADELSAQRVYQFEPTSAVNANNYPTNTLTVVQYNIQSGNSLQCVPDLSQQIATVAGQHPDYFAIQEVNVNVPSRCNCNQPASFSNGTGMHVGFYRTLFFESDSSLYGHGSGSVYPVNSIQSHLFNSWTEERRGVLALVTTPPQFNGRTVLLVSNHYQYDDESTREGQAMETIQFVESLLVQYPGALVIMPGDYYVELGQTAYYMLLSYFNNSWNDFNGGSGLGGCSYPSNAPTNRFDHVWYKSPADLEIKVQNFQILNTTDSDHRPLVVTFEFPSLSTGPTSSPSASPAPTASPSATSSPTSSPTSAPSAPPSSGAQGCKASASISQRAQGGWTDNGVDYSIFDIVVQNTGSNTINALSLSFPDLSKATQSWNYQISNGQVTIPPPFAPGTIFNGAGFILPSTASISGQSLTVSCAVAGTCNGNLDLTISPVVNSAWAEGQIINLVITNNGQNTITDLIVSIATPGTIATSNMWNMQHVSGNDYQIVLYSPLTPGSSINTAGFELDGSTSVSITPSSASACV